MTVNCFVGHVRMFFIYQICKCYTDIVFLYDVVRCFAGRAWEVSPYSCRCLFSRDVEAILTDSVVFSDFQVGS